MNTVQIEDTLQPGHYFLLNKCTRKKYKLNTNKLIWAKLTVQKTLF